MPRPLTELRLDLWAPLSHKRPLRGAAGIDNLAPTWVPADDQRRLNAYKILAAYLSNNARWFLPPPSVTSDDSDADDRREYGDAHLLVQRVAGGVLGDEVQIVVDGADDDLPDEPDIPERPSEPVAEDGQEVDPLEQRVFTIRQQRWQETATRLIDEWEADLAGQPALIARQDWLRQWADDEFAIGKLQEQEFDTDGLGDGVLVLTPSHATGRPQLEVYDPGFYFPVLTDDTHGYPDKVHIAWEFTAADSTGAERRYVRRKTWELMPINAAMFDDELEDFPRDEDTGEVVLADGDRVNADGMVERTYPWQAEGDDPSTVTCVFTDATWPAEDLDGGKVHDFPAGAATYAVTEDGKIARKLDMRMDFIPVVHAPATPASREHFGVSVLSNIAQLLDSLHAVDTDIESAAALIGVPMLALIGGKLETNSEAARARAAGLVDAGHEIERETVIEPGAVFNLPADGDLKSVDVSDGVRALLDVRSKLLDRASENSQVPAEVLGRQRDSGSDPSGVWLALRFGPYRQLIGLLRLTREPKWQLLLKFVQRMAQAMGVLDAGPTPVARIVAGSFLPSDRKEVIELVVSLLTANGVSRLTALRMLVDAGIDIGDLTDELERIEREDVASAVQIADATGSEQAAADRLGIELPEQPAQPAVGPPALNLPPVPGDGGGE